MSDYDLESPFQLNAVLRSLLSDELGKFKNGRPAIWVEPPSSPPSGTGLHVIIDRQPQSLNTDPMSGWQSLANQDFIITLTLLEPDFIGMTTDAQKSAAKDANLQKFDVAIGKIRARFPTNRERSLPYEEGSFPQTVFNLNFNTAINGIAV